MDRLPIQNPTDVAGARRHVVAMAMRMGYDETATGRVAIVVTELAQNLLRHAQGGELLAGADDQMAGDIEIMALDRGPGMTDINACLRDGFSTGGTSGNGLGAVNRLARRMLIHSRPGGGTAVLARMAGPSAQALLTGHNAQALLTGHNAQALPTGHNAQALLTGHNAPARPTGHNAQALLTTTAADRRTATLCVPKPGETVCGDSAAIVHRPDGSVAILLADGLGHGPLAAAASQEAIRLLRKYPLSAPVDLLAILHAGLRATRGAALATASIDPAARQVTYGGIGNIAGFITDSGGIRRMVSHSGTAGHTAGRMQTFQYPLYHHPVLVMFSDGLASSWSPDSHPGLFSEDPAMIAGVLYRDHVRGRDDASVVVWKG